MRVSLAVDTRGTYDGLAAVYLPIAAAVFGVVVLLIVVLVWRGRRRQIASSTERNDRLEIGLAVVLSAVAAVLLGLTFHALDRDSATAAGQPEVVRAVAAKWNWRFEYPSHGIVETGHDGAPAVLTVPAGVEIEFQATSLDVIHGFWIPALKFQRELIPGRTATFRLTFPRPGFTDSGTCSFFCGLEHARMRFVIHVLSRSDYDAWATRR